MATASGCCIFRTLTSSGWNNRCVGQKPFSGIGISFLPVFSLAYSATGFFLTLLYAVLVAALEGYDGLTDFSWIGGSHSGFLTGTAVIMMLLIILLKVSLFTLCIRRVRSLGRSGWWSVLLFPLILLGSVIHPGLIRMLFPVVAGYSGMEALIFTNIWLAPLVMPLLYIVRSLMFVSLGILYLLPSKPVREE